MDNKNRYKDFIEEDKITHTEITRFMFSIDFDQGIRCSIWETIMTSVMKLYHSNLTHSFLYCHLL